MTDDATTGADSAGPAQRDWRRLAVRAVGAVASALVLLGRFVFVTGRFLAVGAALAYTLIADEGLRARCRRWFLLDGNRWIIAGGITGGVFAITSLLLVTDVLGVEQGGFVTTMFSAVISGLFSFVPIVVTVNQLTASRVVGSISDIREDMESAQAFQNQVAAMNADTELVSNNPTPFLEEVFTLLTNRITALQTAVAEQPKAVQRDVEEFVQVVREQADHVHSRLDGDRQRLSELLVPMMGDNYPQNARDARRIELRYGEDLPEPVRELLEEIRELSVTLNLLRQYYKSMYIQQELSRLSRWIGYTGVGSFFVAILVVMGFAQGNPFPGWPLLLDLAVSVALATAVLPFAVLLVFGVRIATISQRTAAPGPFTPLRETPSYARHRSD